MSSNEPENDGTMEFNDSGCVEDVSLPKECPEREVLKPQVVENGYTGQARLLDLSDDVLLCILKYCSPHDLKALGFTCARLGALVLERSLWVTVDSRDVCTSRNRMNWLLGALHQGTRDLMLTGYAEQAKGCRGHVNRTRKEVQDDYAKNKERRDEFLCGRRGIDFDGRYYAAQSTIREVDAPVEIENVNGPRGPERPPFPLVRQHARLHINAQQLPRQSSSPSWPEECEWEDPDAEQILVESTEDTAGCPGPVFTLTAQMFKELRTRCPNLTTLNLECCNINCNKISPSIFPPTLKRLSLRGTRCYNPPLDKSYLFRIHDYLPSLEHLDLSECPWLEPAALLPLSKMANLKVLLMRDCPAMAEFVAYVSLATRYGFRALRVLDLRGSPVGDSEVSALGWLPELQELYLEAPGAPEPPLSPLPHHHYIGDPLPKHPHMDHWELQIPEYYKSRSWSESESAESSVEDVQAQVDMLRETYDHPTHPFSIELHTRVIQAAPRALAQMNPIQPAEGDNDRPARSTLSAREELARGGMVIDDGRSTNAALRIARPGKHLDRNDAKNWVLRNATAPANEAETMEARGVRRHAEDEADAEPGPSKRNKHDENDQNGENSEVSEEGDSVKNGESSESSEKSDGAESKTVAKYKISKHKNVTNPAGPSYTDKKSPEKTSPKTDNNQNSNIIPGLSTTERKNVAADKIVKAIHELQTTIDRSGLGTVRYEYKLGDERKCECNKPDDSPTQPKKPSNYEEEYKTYKYNLRVNDGAGSSKESNTKIGVKDGENKSHEKNNSHHSSKYKIDISAEASTSGYSIRDRIRSNGEPSAKKSRSNSTDKQDKNKKNKTEHKKTDEPSAKSNKNKDVEQESGYSENNEKPQNKRLKSHPASEIDEANLKEQTANETSEESPLMRPCGDSPDDTPHEKQQDLKEQERSENEETPEEELPEDEREEDEREDEEPQDGRRQEIRDEPNQPPQYVRFRRNQDPVIIQCPVYRNEQSANNHQANQPPAVADIPANPAVAEARHHVLYVNLGQQLHAVYRLLPNRPLPLARPAPDQHHLDNSSLVSDASIRRFGRADGEDVNMILIGPNGPQLGRDNSGRPNRSNLRILSAVGYRHITNRSLVHLSTAAPHLRMVDFSNTGVTAEGVDSFKTLRPEVEVKFCPFKVDVDEE